MGRLQRLGVKGFFAQAFSRELFQTLVHIALASLWIMPVIAAGTMTRVTFLIASAALHLALSKWFYFDHAWNRPVIDGGPLGFLSWSIPMLVGSLAYDAVAGKSEGVWFPPGRAVACLVARCSWGWVTCSRARAAPLPLLPLCSRKRAGRSPSGP